MASELAFTLNVAARLALSLTLPPGMTVLVGPSGAGKSTCLLALAGLIRPDSGKIVLAGRTLFDEHIHVPPWQRRVALVFQNLALFPHMTALENVRFGIRDQHTDAHEWLARMRVAHVAARKPSTLSGGEAQRVALARALASSPALLLLDEPFSALDTALRAELAAEVRAVVTQLAIPAILVTHHREDANTLGERIVRLRDGALDA
ncbi:MAG TPA: ATP-binding cassette domain-containing protein [Polyangiales bacterium]|nr:ATP-binding cassette domain-containing protein [Polyangiales bacterium]